MQMKGLHVRSLICFEGNANGIRGSAYICIWCVQSVHVCVCVRARWDRIGEPRDSVLTCGSLVHVGGRSIMDVLLKLPVKTLRAHSLGRRLVYKRNITWRNIIHSRRTRQRAKRRHYDLAAADRAANLTTLPDLRIMLDTMIFG